MNSGALTTLTAQVGGKTQPLLQQTVTITLTGPVTQTVSAISDYLGRVRLPAGFPAGTYSVVATFAGDATYTTVTRTGSVIVAPFTGFFSPVDNAPVINIATAGNAIPVKFSLGADRGLAIFAAGTPTAVKFTCGSGPTDAIEETSSASTSGLTYDAATNQYKYTWKTEKSFKNSCYQLKLTFTDGTSIAANFKFK